MGDGNGRKHRDLGRYAHVKPAAPWVIRCAARHLEGSGTCALARDHRGPHIAYDLLRRPTAVWHPPPTGSARLRDDRPTPAPASDGRADPPAPTGRSRRATTLGGRSRPSTPAHPSRLLARVWRHLTHMGDHLEELFLAILFLAFVWFVVEWAVRMAVGG